MKKILLIEDDNFKAESLETFFSEFMFDCEIEIRTNLAESIEIINKQKFDWVMVDMSIPSHPIVSGEGAPVSFLTGGLDVILELQALGRSDKCIIVTQYPEIEICGQFFHINEATHQINVNLGCSIVGCIEYADNSTSWKQNLKVLLLSL
ncbi:response regulator [Acinetobacter lwoffii]|jgi:ActR/RegA family two-component response regulator|uniref:response regulator n=1 Tax=Acinetobacter TaxID=469 RepID=UPI0030095DAD